MRGSKRKVAGKKRGRKNQRSVAVKKRAGKKPEEVEWVKTKIPGFDQLFDKGIPKGINILVAGGPGTGKTIFCLQSLFNMARTGHDTLYITFEETPARLTRHMKRFGWNYKGREEDSNVWSLRAGGDGKSGRLVVTRQDPFKIARSVEALLAKASGHLRMEMEGIPELIPPKIFPRMIALDSITALESAFVGKPESYRVYIEQLFRLFEELGATTFLITETEEAPKRYSKTGVEEFLADGVFVMYNLKVRDTRARAIEILKLRGAKHERKVVPFIIAGNGIEVFPDERVYEV